MQKFVEFRAAKAAFLFGHYCQRQGYAVVIEQQGDMTTLSVAPAELAAVQALLTQFLAEPEHPRYQAAAWQHGRSVSIDMRNFNVSAGLTAFIKGSPYSAVILLLTMVVYGWQQLDFTGARALLQLSDPTAVWRWITPIFLHFSLVHLVFNLMWWGLLGHQIERRMGTLTLLQLSVSSAVVSNGVQFAMVGANFGGLSGVVYALLGYCWLDDKLQRRRHYPVNDTLAVFMVVWLLLGFMDLLWVSVANWAHLGGLGSGLLWALLAKQRSPKKA